MAPSSLLAPQRALCSGRGVGGGINNADSGEGAREACENKDMFWLEMGFWGITGFKRSHK